MAYLVVRSGRRELYRGEIVGPVMVGRAPECDIRILDTQVSRMHCRVEREEDGFSVTDLGSKNGTYVHSAKIERHVLKDGESFVVGDRRITFHADELMPARPENPIDDPRNSDSTIYPSITDTPHLLDGTLAAVKVVIGEPVGAVTRAKKKDDSTIAASRPLAFQRPPAAPRIEPPPAPPSPPALPAKEIADKPSRSRAVVFTTIGVAAAGVAVAFIWLYLMH